MGVANMTKDFGVLTGNEKLPFDGFVASGPGDKPDTCTASMRGWEKITTAEGLAAAVDAQQARFAAARAAQTASAAPARRR